MTTNKLDANKIFEKIPKQFWTDLYFSVRKMIREDSLAGEVQEYTQQTRPTSGGAKGYSKGYAKYKANYMNRFRDGKKLKAYAGKSVSNNLVSSVNMRVTGHTIEGLYLQQVITNGIILSYRESDRKKIEGNEEMGRVITTLNQKNKDKVLDLYSAQLDKSLQAWCKDTVTIYAGK
jgi:hypothetical protein